MLWKKITFNLLLVLAGASAFYLLLAFAFTSPSPQAGLIKNAVVTVGFHPREIIGFLPYWLAAKADKDYSPYITTLAYFALTVASDGTIQKYSKPGETEPGWLALSSGKMAGLFASAQSRNVKISLTIFNGNQDEIGQIISNPITHAASLMKEIAPLMKEYHFTVLNLDIESVADASSSGQTNLTTFVREIRNSMNEQKLGTLSIDISPTDLIKERLINPVAIAPLVDSIILMTYDYHYIGSSVSGPVAPVGGAGEMSEFDVETAVQKALVHIPKEKIILGTPLYGYQWETITESTRSAILPGSGITVSNRTMEESLAGCATCSAELDSVAQESYVVYKDTETGMYYQASFPDNFSTRQKIKLANAYDLRGLALWALGYEGTTILQPLSDFKKTLQ